MPLGSRISLKNWLRISAAAGAGLALVGLFAFQTSAERAPRLGSITPHSLLGHVSFLASDALEGRGTPSTGQDVAAEYIAAQFRRAGLEPVRGNDYFQWANWPLGSDQPYARVRNVAGLLRGADPELAKTYIVVSAHYDHLGINPNVIGDNIFNGANDNASGTASVIELASALGAGQRPRRSILFICFFGEELGLLGAKYYASHPLVPLRATVANINLEQLGRYDTPQGPRPASLNLTGFDYSNIGPLFARLGEAAGIAVTGDGKNSDSFYARSDNFVFANAGIPAHTFSAALEYGDYHLVSDHWPRLDYANMARLVALIATGVQVLANADGEPEWNMGHPQGMKYGARRRGG